jgi:hypothetical protein
METRIIFIIMDFGDLTKSCFVFIISQFKQALNPLTKIMRFEKNLFLLFRNCFDLTKKFISWMFSFILLSLNIKTKSY